MRTGIGSEYSVGDRVVVHPREKKRMKRGTIVGRYFDFCNDRPLMGVEVEGTEYLYRIRDLRKEDIYRFDEKYGKI